ncbi:hypothetical protein BB559_002782 [Furculomyces boomerangus]|uniref:WIBG Mago-binding domain-containing protein n=1 Tax=Furculomyces boomerangus TaxID=61424 RepID=A0A2T9YSH6_9FUNG|nr:hypothetical protein BB559_002782 [Furculomyces boomerangus]
MDFNKLDFYTLSRIFEYSRNINVLQVSKRFSEVAENSLVMARYFSKIKHFRGDCCYGWDIDKLEKPKNSKKIFEHLLQILYGTEAYYEHKYDFYNFVWSNDLGYIYYNLYTKSKLEKNTRTCISFGKSMNREIVEYSLKPVYNTEKEFEMLFSGFPEFPIIPVLLASCFEVDVIKEFGFDKDLVGEEPGKRIIRLYKNNPFEDRPYWVSQHLISVKAYSLLFYFMKNNPIPAADVTDILECAIRKGDVFALDNILQIYGLKLNQCFSTREILEIVKTRTMFYRIANDFDINEIDYDFILDSPIFNRSAETFICAFECKFLGSNKKETDLEIQPLLKKLFQTDNKFFLYDVIVGLVNLKVKIPKQILEKTLNKKDLFMNRYGLLSRFPEDLDLMTNDKYTKEVINAARQRNAILLKFLNQYRTLEYDLCINTYYEHEFDLYIYLIRAGFKSEVTEKIIFLYGCNKGHYGILLKKFVKSKKSITKLVSFGIKKKYKALYDCFSEFKEQLEFTEEDFLNACKNGFLDVVKQIIEKTKLDDEVLEEGLFIAFKKYRVEIFQLLVQHGAKFRYFSFDIGEIAVGRSSHKGLIMALKNGAKIDYTKESIFHNACKYGHFQIVKQIVTKHRPSNLGIYKGIFFAVRHNQNKTMDYLLNQYSGTRAFYNDLLKIAFDRDNLIGMKKLYLKGAYFSSFEKNSIRKSRKENDKELQNGDNEIKKDKDLIIPASVRPDGSIRKEKKVREGFIREDMKKRYVIPMRREGYKQKAVSKQENNNVNAEKQKSQKVIREKAKPTIEKKTKENTNISTLKPTQASVKSQTKESVMVMSSELSEYKNMKIIDWADDDDFL